MLVKNYLDLIKETSKDKTIKRLTYISNKAFNTNYKVSKIKIWLKFNIISKKETLLIGMRDDEIYSQCTYSVLDKNRNYWYGKYAKTNKFLFLSDFASIKKGYGRLCLNQVISLADSLGYDIILNILNKDLINYYKSYGFKLLKRHSYTMVRKYKESL